MDNNYVVESSYPDIRPQLGDALQLEVSTPAHGVDVDIHSGLGVHRDIYVLGGPRAWLYRGITDRNGRSTDSCARSACLI